jgi:hypothetical protein
MNCELMLTYDTPAYMFNVYKNQLSQQTGSRNLTGPKKLPTGTLIYSFFAFPYYTIIIPPLHRRGIYCFTSVRPSICLSVQDIFRHIFLSNYWWQKSDIWSQASYRYAILWEAFLDPSDSYFLFADLIGFYTHWTYMRGYHKWAWHTYMKLVTKYQISAINSCWEKCDEKYLGRTDRWKDGQR